MTYFLFTFPILPKCQYLMKCWTEFSHVQSEWFANGVASNLYDWAVQDSYCLLLLKIAKTWKWQFSRTSEWIQTNIVSHKSFYEAITIFSQIDHPKLLPLPLLKIAKIWNIFVKFCCLALSCYNADRRIFLWMPLGFLIQYNVFL